TPSTTRPNPVTRASSSQSAALHGAPPAPPPPAGMPPPPPCARRAPRTARKSPSSRSPSSHVAGLKPPSSNSTNRALGPAGPRHIPRCSQGFGSNLETGCEHQGNDDLDAGSVRPPSYHVSSIRVRKTHSNLELGQRAYLGAFLFLPLNWPETIAVRRWVLIMAMMIAVDSMPSPTAWAKKYLPGDWIQKTLPRLPK